LIPRASKGDPPALAATSVMLLAASMINAPLVRSRVQLTFPYIIYGDVARSVLFNNVERKRETIETTRYVSVLIRNNYALNEFD